MQTKLTPEEVTARVTAALNTAIDSLKADGITSALCAAYAVQFPERPDISSQGQIRMSVHGVTKSALVVMAFEMTNMARKFAEDVAQMTRPDVRQGDVTCH